MNKKYTDLINRIAISIIFIWFGSLKLIQLSPANDLVESLLSKTLPFIPFYGFIIFLGIWETLIGILFLFPRLTKIAFILLAIQMFTTFGPLLFLPEIAWQKIMTPTLEGQYIIKNLIVVALGLTILNSYNNENRN